MTTTINNKTIVRNKVFTAIIALVGAVALPQVFHAVGSLSGTGTLLGSAFLPMHIPVLIAALLGGPIVGITAGALSPIVSFAISGMPSVIMLPLMIIELAVYGLVGGLLAKSKMPVFAKLVITQIAGRAARAAAVLLAVYGFSSGVIEVSSIVTMVTTSLPGILLQWAIIPLALYRMDGLKKLYE